MSVEERYSDLENKCCRAGGSLCMCVCAGVHTRVPLSVCVRVPLSVCVRAWKVIDE